MSSCADYFLTRPIKPTISSLFYCREMSSTCPFEQFIIYSISSSIRKYMCFTRKQNTTREHSQKHNHSFVRRIVISKKNRSPSAEDLYTPKRKKGFLFYHLLLLGRGPETRKGRHWRPGGGVRPIWLRPRGCPHCRPVRTGPRLKYWHGNSRMTQLGIAADKKRKFYFLKTVLPFCLKTYRTLVYILYYISFWSGKNPWG